MMKQINLDLGHVYGPPEVPFPSDARDERHYPTFTYTSDEDSDDVEIPKAGKMLIEYELQRVEEIRAKDDERCIYTISVLKIVGLEESKASKKAEKADEALDKLRDELMEKNAGDDEDDD